MTLDVKNIGDRNGAHSVLIYGKRDVYALAGFEKVFLEAGECVTITILLNEEYEFMRIGEELYI